MSLKETSDLLKNIFKDKKAVNLTLDNGQVLQGLLPIKLEQRSYGSMPTFTYKDENGIEHTIEVSRVSAVEANSDIELSHDLINSSSFWSSSLFSPLGLNTFSSTSSSIQTSSSTSLFGENKRAEDLFKSSSQPIHSSKLDSHDSKGSLTPHEKSQVAHETATTVSDKAQNFFDTIKAEAEATKQQVEQKAKEEFDATGQKVVEGKKSIASTLLKVLFFIIFIAILLSAISPIFKAVFNKANGVPAPEPTTTQIVNRDFLYGEDDTMVTDAGIYYDDSTLPARDPKTDTDFSAAALTGLTDKAEVKIIESTNDQCSANLQNLTIPEDTTLYPAGSASKEASYALAQKVYSAYVLRAKAAGEDIPKGTISTAKMKKFKPNANSRYPDYNYLEMSQLVLTDKDGSKTYFEVRVIPSAHKALVVSNDCSIGFEDMQDKLPDIKYFMAGLS
jgi:hypothetical protein